MRYLAWFGSQHEGRVPLKNSNTLPDHGFHDWRKNDEVACVLLDRSLQLMQDWPKNIDRFVRNDQPKYNRLWREYKNGFPSILDPLRKPLRRDAYIS